jgi:hypothetical protein
MAVPLSFITAYAARFETFKALLDMDIYIDVDR